MKLFEFHVFWRYSSENYEKGVVWAENEERAKDKLTNAPQYKDCIGISIYGEITPDEEITVIYRNN